MSSKSNSGDDRKEDQLNKLFNLFVPKDSLDSSEVKKAASDVEYKSFNLMVFMAHLSKLMVALGSKKDSSLLYLSAYFALRQSSPEKNKKRMSEEGLRKVNNILSSLGCRPAGPNNDSTVVTESRLRNVLASHTYRFRRAVAGKLNDWVEDSGISVSIRKPLRFTEAHMVIPVGSDKTFQEWLLWRRSLNNLIFANSKQGARKAESADASWTKQLRFINMARDQIKHLIPNG